MCDFLQVLSDNTVKVYFYLENMNMHFYCVCHTDSHSISMSQKKSLKLSHVSLQTMMKKLMNFVYARHPLPSL